MPINPSQKLSTNSINIGELFKSRYFEIPTNQREYRWEEEQIKKLWDDLICTLRNDNEETETHGHFLGAIVVIGNENSFEHSRLQVIDGQQRLTTLTILAECLRQHIDDIIDRKQRKRLDHILTECIMSPNANNAPRVQLNHADEFYQNSLIENETYEDKQKYWKEHQNKKSEVEINIKNTFSFFLFPFSTNK